MISRHHQKLDLAEPNCSARNIERGAGYPRTTDSPAALLLLAVFCLTGCSTVWTQTSPKSWNEVTEGMTRQEMITRVGPPDFTSNSSATELWRRDGWELRAAFDQNGRATNVVRVLVLE